MLPPKNKSRENQVTIIASGAPQPSGSVIAPTTADIKYTKKNSDSRLKRKTSGFIGSETEGIKVDQSGHTTAKPFSRKVVVSGGSGGYTRIYGDDGKLIKQGRGNTKEIEDAVKESEKHVALTNSQRQKNERANNLIGGTATNITQKDVDDLNADDQATGNPTDPKVLAAAAKEQARSNLTEKNKSKAIKVKVVKK